MKKTSHFVSECWTLNANGREHTREEALSIGIVNLTCIPLVIITLMLFLTSERVQYGDDGFMELSQI